MPRKKQNVGEHLETWVIKDVAADTRRTVKVYAAMHDLTVAQALAALVEKGMQYDEFQERAPLLMERIRQRSDRQGRQDLGKAALLRDDLPIE